MKKLISIIMAAATCVTLTACSGTPTSESSDKASDPLEGVEFVKTGEADRRVAGSLEDLEKYSDIAVVGEFIEDDVPKLTYRYSEHFGKDIISSFESYNTIEVKKVLMGDVNVGDKLTIAQYYAIDNGKLYTISELTPMIKGDEWIFFLSKQDDADIYWCTCDSDGRYPTKNSAAQNSRITSVAPEYQLGVYNEWTFKRNIYNEIVEKYDV